MEVLIDIHGFESPGEVLVVDLDGILIIFVSLLLNKVVDVNFLELKEGLHSHGADLKINKLIFEMVHVVDWTVNLLEKDESLKCLEQIEMVSETDVERETEWAHEFWENVPHEVKEEVTVVNLHVHVARLSFQFDDLLEELLVPTIELNGFDIFKYLMLKLAKFSLNLMSFVMLVG